MYPESLRLLVESLKYFPGIGEKTAERLAFSVLEMEDEQISLLVEALSSLKESLKCCDECNVLAEKEICDICSDNTRENTLCVVEDSKSVFLFEKLGMFGGKYHVLNGLISPLDGINPEDIGIPKLLDRINKYAFNEIIFAFKPTIEGETTALYIKKILDGLNIKVTRLASGLPMGADMEYIDSLTLERAIRDRKELE